MKPQRGLSTGWLISAAFSSGSRTRGKYWKVFSLGKVRRVFQYFLLHPRGSLWWKTAAPQLADSSKLVSGVCQLFFFIYDCYENIVPLFPAFCPFIASHVLSFIVHSSKKKIFQLIQWWVMMVTLVTHSPNSKSMIIKMEIIIAVRIILILIVIMIANNSYN